MPRGTVLADGGYGSAEFREGCRKLGLDFAVAVSSTTRVRAASVRQETNDAFGVAA